jgi:uncharacterized protein (TIGR02600 family)
VGRVAFWTDDECSKVNINTASEGTFADTPIANSTFSAPASGSSGGAFGATNSYCGDLQLSMYPGGLKEYQRYPGHPATTCLSTVVGNYLGTGLTHWQIAQAITDAVPRISEYGSPGGSVPVSSQAGSFSLVYSGYATTNVAPDMDRLYSSVDEFAFKAPSAVATSRTQQSFSTASVSTLPIAQTCRFFLTADSKAPELNLFGLPRVAMWPVWSDAYASSRTTLDNEILRCATVATNATGYVHPMIFSRYDSTSPVNDWSTTLGGQMRNQQLYGYLQALTSRAVPGYGGTISSKYGNTDRDQILTEIYDYIRCTDIQDASVNIAAGTHGYSYTGSFTGTTLNGQQNSGQSPLAPGNSPGQVVPIQITAPGTGTITQGFGRIALVSELALAFFKVDDRTNTLDQNDQYNVSPSQLTLTNTITGSDPNTTETPPLPAKYTPGVATNPQTLVEWALIPMLASPSAGWAGIANNIRIKFSGVNLHITDTGYTSSSNQVNNGYSAAITNSVTTPMPDVFATGQMSNDRDSVIGGIMGAEALIDNTTLSMVPTGLYLANSPSSQTGFGGTIGNLTYYGTVTVQVFAPSTATTPIQTIVFNFPNTIVRGQPLGNNAPIPDLDYGYTNVGVNQWYGTYRAAPNDYAPGTNNSAFTYPTIYNRRRILDR